MTISTSFSLIASQYPLEKAEYIGILEAATGFGLMIGPPIGSFMYGFFQYAWAFYIFSIIIFIVIILQVVLIPSKLNIKYNLDEMPAPLPKIENRNTG